ncbi:MAG: ankyrin repeat domain-containing protein [Kineosporiaceae bacterium]|nr:ankyrin repeat domain-containing protein [Kineosporiaceae bacterium]
MTARAGSPGFTRSAVPAAGRRTRARTSLAVMAALAASVLLVAGLGACGAPSDPGEALLTAAGHGDVHGVRDALSRGASLDGATDRNQSTALTRAAYQNRVEVAQLLVESGADVNRKDSSEQSPYLIATSEVGDDPRLLDLFLAHGADVSATDSYNGTGAIRAAHRGYPVIVGRLIAAGVDVDHVNRLGWTALLEAVILGNGGEAHQAVVARLLAAGADRSLRDPQGRTALEIARERGHDAMVALLEPPG